MLEFLHRLPHLALLTTLREALLLLSTFQREEAEVRDVKYLAV